MGKLTDKREAFVLAYIGDARFNATLAAKQAGYSERSAYAEGARLLKDDVIAARIREELSNRAMSADAVLSELAALATADDTRFSTVRFDPLTGEIVERRVDLNPKIKALELVGKAHGIFTERVDISGSMTSTIELVGINADDV